ncbi:MAG TPA: hypothetical protein VGO23_12935, partial [Pseudonocardia sp.]|nr:hypothetical protein [Pseudonocardia sp.]
MSTVLAARSRSLTFRFAPQTTCRESPTEPGPTDPGEPVADNATSLGEARADQIARAGAPYPYSSPLPAAARDAHEQAAARAFSAYLK